jgi:hypothetical protein
MYGHVHADCPAKFPAIGPRGPPGATGPTGPTGEIGPIGDAGRSALAYNPLDVAILKWTPFLNPLVNTVSIVNGIIGPAQFDGTNILTPSGFNAVAFFAVQGPGNVSSLGSVPVTGSNTTLYDGTAYWMIGSATGGSASITKYELQVAITATYTLFASVFRASAFDGKRVWAHNTTDGSLYEFTASALGVLTPTVHPLLAPGTLCPFMCFDGTDLWMTDSTNGLVHRINSGVIIASYPVGNTPQGIMYDGRNIWVAVNLSNMVVKLDRNTGAVLSSVSVSRPFNLAFDGYKVWVISTTAGQLYVINASNSTLTATYAVIAPAAILFDGKSIWVSASGNQMVRF